VSASRVGYNTADVDITKNSITVSITGSTANNLLIAGVCVRMGVTISTPAGWTLIRKGESGGGVGTVSAALFYRIADGSESSVTISWNAAYEAAAFVAQYSGLATSGVLDASSEDESYLNTANSTGYFGSSTPTQQPGRAIAFSAFLVEGSSPSRSYSSSFNEWFRYSKAFAYDPVVAIADRAYTALSALSPSVTYGSAVKHYGALALFKEPAAGGGGSASGVLAVTLAAVSVSASGALTVSGSASNTLAAVGISAAGAVAVTGSASSTLAAATLSGAGAVAVAGASAVTLADVSLSGAGAVGSSPISGALSVALSDVLAAASGAVAITGAAGLSIGSLGLSAAGAVAVGIDAPIGGKPRDPEIQPVAARLALFDERDLLETVPIIMGIINAARR